MEFHFPAGSEKKTRRTSMINVKMCRLHVCFPLFLYDKSVPVDTTSLIPRPLQDREVFFISPIIFICRNDKSLTAYLYIRKTKPIFLACPHISKKPLCTNVGNITAKSEITIFLNSFFIKLAISSVNYFGRKLSI